MADDGPLDALGRRPRVYRRRIHPLVEFSEVKFQARYRLSKHAVRHLVRLYGNFCTLMGWPTEGIPTEDRFCMALRYLATGSNYSVVGDYQGVSKATVSRSVHTVVHFLYVQHDLFIHWPNRPVDKLRAAVEWHQSHGHPRVIGAIDGCHVAIRTPKDNDGAFVNRHGWHSLNVMMICNANLAFTHVDPTWGGSVGDGHIYNQSLIHDEEVNGALDPFFIIGDSGYSNTNNLFTPVRHPTTNRELEYNRWHRSARSTVERSFGRLKQRWRCLDAHGGYLYHTPETSGKIVMACAALHNVALQFGVPVADDGDFDGFQPHHADPGQPPNAPPPAGDLQQNHARRNFMFDRF